MISNNLKDVLLQLEELPFYESEGQESVYNKDLLRLVKNIGRNQKLAEQIWVQNIRSAKHLAIRISEPQLMNENDLDRWVKDIADWGTCDAFCAHVVRGTPFAIDKAFEWADRENEFEKRAGFSTIAQLAWKKSDMPNEVFIDFLPLVEKHAVDDRYYVKKAVNWALRDIGKRNANLKKDAVQLAQKLQQSDNKVVKWIGTHRITELD